MRAIIILTLLVFGSLVQAAHPIPLQQLTWTNIKVEGKIPPNSTDGSFKITVQWNRLPRDVQWYPEANQSLSITNIVIQNIGGQTQITFNVHIQTGATAPASIGSVLSYTDESGQRHTAPVVVPLR